MKKQILAAAGAVLFAATSSMAGAQVGFHIRIVPPPPRRERVPPPPPEHRDWVWHQGYHRWDGRAYAWVPGEYVAPPHPHARWVPGHYAHRRGEYVWIEGHWR
jgi:hypothetical protein